MFSDADRINAERIGQHRFVDNLANRGRMAHKRAVIVDGKVATGLKLDGKRVRLTGTAERFGKKIAVHEEHDDAGYHIVVDGFHKRLDTDLAMTWRKKTVPLTCDSAFFYDLVVQKTPTA